MSHDDSERWLIEAWPGEFPETGQPAPAEPERPEVPWWVVGLVVVLLWGPLLGAVVRPYRYPD